MKHYATRYKDRIRFLEKMIREYYMAIYNAQEAIRGDGELVGSGVCGITSMETCEEAGTIHDVKGLKQLINEMPLHDCGC